jgi:hypothetical protein
MPRVALASRLNITMRAIAWVIGGFAALASGCVITCGKLPSTTRIARAVARVPPPVRQ